MVFFTHAQSGNGWIDFAQIWHVDSLGGCSDIKTYLKRQRNWSKGLGGVGIRNFAYISHCHYHWLLTLRKCTTAHTRDDIICSRACAATSGCINSWYRRVPISPYLGDGWIYRHEIWHADAVCPSWPFRFENRPHVYFLTGLCVWCLVFIFKNIRCTEWQDSLLKSGNKTANTPCLKKTSHLYNLL